MKYANWIYGAALAIIALVLKTVEYRYSVRDLSTEGLILAIAILFAGLGLWAGWQLSRPRQAITATVVDPSERLQQLGISKREYEILQLVATGSTNQEIADQLFISLNTVKTHLSNLYQKLDVRRRTQAVEKGKQLGLVD
ncbi:MAG: response regulator transcription factor [Bacteroidota bacterium]